MKRSKDHLRLVVDRRAAEARIRGVYLVTDQGERLPERVREAIDGGVAIVQFRDKGRDATARAKLGRELRDICAAASIPLVVNDDMELARELAADGVHLGQGDGDPAAARQLLGPHKLIGVSTHNLEEARAAEAAGADYIGFGAMYPTDSKDVEHLPGPDALAAIRPAIAIPIVAIGGINRGNAGQIIDSGADAVAVISGILGQLEPALAAAELTLLFNRREPEPRGTILTVAGSDSGGGAGIQADLKTITLLGSYGASVITTLTAQNTRGVTDIHWVPPEFVAAQLDAVLSDIPVDVVKTGMLFSSGAIEVLAEKLMAYGRRIVVVDPVMLATGGASLIDGSAIVVMREQLFPLTYLLTPNIPEAEKLTGLTITDEAGMEEAAWQIRQMGVRNVLVKGGHLPEGTAVDILYDGSTFARYQSSRFLTRNTHGTGCTLASAIATFLARGEPLPAAVARAKEFITTAIRLATPLGSGHGPVNHFLAAQQMRGQGPGTGDQGPGTMD